MIHTEGLRKVYTTGEIETTAVNGVALNVDAGESVAVMGPSGCGKSTLLNLLGLIDRPTGGRHIFMGRDVIGLSERQRTQIRKRNIGFVFQSFNLIEEMTIFENVELPLVYQGVPSRERRRRVCEVLDNFGLDHRAKHLPQQLSGGQQQRAAVARAVVGKPELILADEPTGNLDSSHGEEVMNALSRLNRSGTTIVMVTHAEVYAAFCRRVVRLLDGSVVSEEIN
jgi:putative ABC transport system ATP-binding protein